jgi:hypothetical protein
MGALRSAQHMYLAIVKQREGGQVEVPFVSR